jgi:hypothetical protein
VKKYDPLVPREIESLSQFLLIVDHAEPALRVGMEESGHIRDTLHRGRSSHGLAGSQV